MGKNNTCHIDLVMDPLAQTKVHIDENPMGLISWIFQMYNMMKTSIKYNLTHDKHYEINLYKACMNKTDGY